jgi:hypothetical protein
MMERRGRNGKDGSKTAMEKNKVGLPVAGWFGSGRLLQ